MKATRNETNTARFGRVVTYTLVLDGVTFTAERMVGLHDDYSISTHVGHCGMSHQTLTVRLPAGHATAARFEALAERLRQDPTNFVSASHNEWGTISEGICTDRTACDTYRGPKTVNHNEASPADLDRARTAGVYAFNTGHPKVWQDSQMVRDLFTYPREQHTERGKQIIARFEASWQQNADYQIKRDAERAAALAERAA
jgi:hypothetical protein